MTRYEALLEQFKKGKTELEEAWLVCPDCWGAWVGFAGDLCICGGTSHQAPLFKDMAAVK